MTPAEAYEAFLVPSVFGPWAEAVVTRVPPASGARVLDVACGTAIASRVAAKAIGPRGRVVGVDLDPGMLAVARAAAGRSVSLVRGDAMALPLASGSFDYAVSLEGMQFFPDRVAGVREIRRVLRPGGRFVASVWNDLDANPGYAALAEGLRAFVSDEAGRLPPFALADAADVREVAAAAFEDVDVSVAELTLVVPSAEAFVDWVATGGPTIRRNLAALPDARRAEFGRFVDERLARYRTGGGLALPSRRTIVSASRSAG